jgi:hypothetical protein
VKAHGLKYDDLALEDIPGAGEAHFVYLWTESSLEERLVLVVMSREVPLTGSIQAATLEVVSSGSLAHDAVVAAVSLSLPSNAAEGNKSVDEGPGSAGSGQFHGSYCTPLFWILALTERLLNAG